MDYFKEVKNLIMQDEIWKDIEGYKGLHQVSNLGKVKRFDTIRTETTLAGDVINVSVIKGHELKQSVSVHGYMVCGLSSHGNTAVIGVHRLVAEAFLPHVLEQNEVHHKDKNTFNNAVCNLEWVTSEDHAEHHRRKHKRTYLKR